MATVIIKADKNDFAGVMMIKQQDYTIIFVIFLYIFVLRRFNFNVSDSGDIVTLLLCFFLVFRSAFRIYSDKNNKDHSDENKK